MSDCWTDVIGAVNTLLSENMIHADVHAAALKATRRLALTGLNAPMISTHGPDSVVLNWGSGGKPNFYLIISKNKISALLS